MTGAEPAPWTAPRHPAPAYAVDADGCNVLAGLVARAEAGGVPLLVEPPAAEDALGRRRAAPPTAGCGCRPGAGWSRRAGGRPRSWAATSWSPTGCSTPKARRGWRSPRSPAVRAETLSQALGLLQAAGLQVSVVDDVPGLVVARTVASW